MQPLPAYALHLHSPLLLDTTPHEQEEFSVISEQALLDVANVIEKPECLNLAV